MDYKHIIDVDILGLLLSFYDDLEGFNQGLERICQKHRNIDVGKLLEAIVSEKKVFMMPRDVKEFYEEYQDFFQAVKDIRQASPDYFGRGNLVYPFLFTNYNIPGDGHLKTYHSFATFYQYLQDHEEEIPKMPLLVDKLKSLHIFDVILDEDADFTKGVYDTSSWGNKDIVLLDNMETLPTYQKGIAQYHSTYSRYKTTRPYDERRC